MGSTTSIQLPRRFSQLSSTKEEGSSVVGEEGRRDSRRDSLKSFLRLRRQSLGHGGNFHLTSVHERKADDYYNIFDLDDEILGRGAMATVLRGTHKMTAAAVALKVYRLETESTRESALREISVLGRLDHPNIIHSFEAFLSTPDRMLHVLLEQCRGGDLLQFQKANATTLPESRVQNLAKQMLCALCHLHDRGLVHRDIKLENWVFRDEGQDQLVLIDFSSSYEPDKSNHSFKRPIGTPKYMAPEVLGSKISYGSACDVWGVGVGIFLLLANRFPFNGSDLGQLKDSVLHSSPDFEEEPWCSKLSPTAKQFVLALLEKNDVTRVSARRAMVLPWLSSKQDELENSDVDLLSSRVDDFVQKLKSFLCLPKLVQVALYFVAHFMPDNLRCQSVKQFQLLYPRERGQLELKHLRKYCTTLKTQQLARLFELADWSATGSIELTTFTATQISRNDVTQAQWEQVFLYFSRCHSGRYFSLESLEDLCPEPWSTTILQDSFKQAQPFIKDNNTMLRNVPFQAFLEMVTAQYPSHDYPREYRRQNSQERDEDEQDDETFPSVGPSTSSVDFR